MISFLLTLLDGLSRKLSGRRPLAHFFHHSFHRLISTVHFCGKRSQSAMDFQVKKSKSSFRRIVVRCSMSILTTAMSSSNLLKEGTFSIGRHFVPFSSYFWAETVDSTAIKRRSPTIP
jgi:hypothetical protein